MGLERGRGGANPRTVENLPVTRVRFRYNAAIAIAGFLAFLGAIPLATAGFGDRTRATPWYAYPLLLIFLLPLAMIVWGWRAGTDAGAEGLRIRRYGLGSEPIAWSEIVGIVPQNRRVYAILSDDRAVPLPGVNRDNIPRLIAASGQKLTTEAPEDVADPEDSEEVAQ